MTRSSNVNLLVIVTAAGSQAAELSDRLVQGRFHVTRVSASGSLLDETPVSLLVGLDRLRLSHLLDLIRACCQTRRRFIPAQIEFSTVPPLAMIEAEVGGAIIYTLTVERFEQL